MNQTYKPCPEQQLWGDLDESSYLEVGTATCPPGTNCPRNTYSITNGIEESLILGNGNKQGCWMDANVTTKPVYTCTDDKYCKNLDLNNSEAGNLVYKCPNATCSIGNCNCGPECIQDSRSKICVPPTEIQPTYNPDKEPIPTPPVNQCTKAQIGLDQYVCWKRTKEVVNEKEYEYIVDCDPSLCGLELKKGVSKLAGSNITVYSEGESSGGYNEEPESSGQPPSIKPDPLLIVGYTFGAIALMLLGYLIYSMFKKSSKTHPKGKRRNKFG